MKNEGECRVAFFFSGPPPRTYSCRRRYKRRKQPVPFFEPYREALPLEAGYYSFVLDGRGRFRVERGNTSSHGGMVNGEPVGAAGHFVITRAGKVGRVVCISNDYWLFFLNERHRTVGYVISAFQNHEAFEVSRHAIFQFSKQRGVSFFVSLDGVIIEDTSDRQRLLDEEDQGTEQRPPFSPRQIAAYRRYTPSCPPRLYPIKHDQLDSPIDYDDNVSNQTGPFNHPYTPEDGPLTSGRKAFVIDDEGRMVVGFGHHLLSGGNPVGAAGQINVDETGLVTAIHLNFSGHYRPPLSAEYARYTYRSLARHPLLTIAPDCLISARKYDRHDMNLETVSFTVDELLSDGPELEYWLDAAFDAAADIDEDVDTTFEEDGGEC